MSGFAEQRAKIRQALIAGGVSADDATRIANILGNSEQSLYHAGEDTQDTTPPGLRQVTPNLRKVQFPSLDFRPGDPDHRPPRTRPSEEKKKKEQQPNVTTTQAPQCVIEDVQFRVTPGTLTDVQNNGQSATIDVRSVINGKPPGGNALVTIDPAANMLVGKAPKSKVPADGSVRLDVEQNAAEMRWNIQLPNRSEYDVVTNIEFVEDEGLVIHYDKIKAWKQNQTRRVVIPAESKAILTEMVEDRHGLRASSENIPVLGRPKGAFIKGNAPSFFNVFRVGTFTGGWNIGDTKEVTQTWPTSDVTVTVMNLTQNIPDDGSETPKNVLFAVRTEDTSVGNADDDPHPTFSAPVRANGRGEPVQAENDPPVTYYAIEIQNGPSDDGEGGGPPPVTVLTHATRTPYGLEFERKKLYVWAVPETPLVVEDCCSTGACCFEGECSITTEADCAGTWQGAGTTCEDGDCNYPCCFSEESCGEGDSAVPYYKCGEGYFASTCESLDGTVPESCDGFVAQPGTGHPLCEDGGPAQLTVTIAGVTAVDPGDNDVAAACNNAFVLDFPGSVIGTCTLWARHIEVVDGKTIVVEAVMSPFLPFGVAATLSVYPFVWTPGGAGSPDSSLSHQTGVVLPVVGQDCAGRDIYDCQTYTLAPGQTTGGVGGTVDTSSATIGIS